MTPKDGSKLETQMGNDQYSFILKHISTEKRNTIPIELT